MWHAPCSHEMGGRCAAGTGVVRGEYAVAKDVTRGARTSLRCRGTVQRAQSYSEESDPSSLPSELTVPSELSVDPS